MTAEVEESSNIVVASEDTKSSWKHLASIKPSTKGLSDTLAIDQLEAIEWRMMRSLAAASVIRF